MAYLHYFKTQSQFDAAYNGTGYTEPWVSCVLESKNSRFNKYNPNGHEYVDLGLPSGTLWATCNLGASDYTERGRYIRWGEIESYVSNRDYKFGMDRPYTKYEEGVDNKTVLELCDDAASMLWGGSWHIPSPAQWEELFEYTTDLQSEVISQADIRQVRQSNVNGNIIKLKRTGNYVNGQYTNGSDYYWTNTSVLGTVNAYAYRITNDTTGPNLITTERGRKYGMAIVVRPVMGYEPKRWDGVSSVLDLRDIENNPNIELKSRDWAYPEYNWPDTWPYWITDSSTASTQDKYNCYRFKNFVLPGLTGSTPIIKTILTDWEEAWGQTGNTGTMVLRGEAYDWGASGYDYGVYWIEIGEYGGILSHVYD